MKKIIVISDAARNNDIFLACLKVFFPECEVEIRFEDKAAMNCSASVLRTQETIEFKNASKYSDRG